MIPRRYLVALLPALLVGAFVLPARADEHGHERHDRHDHRMVERHDRHHHEYRPDYGYGVPTYGVEPPPLVYSPPPPPPGINFLFDFR